MDNISAPNVVDIIALVLIAIGGIRGFYHGLSGEIGHLTGVVVSFLAAIFAYGWIAAWMAGNTVLSERTANAVAFIVTFIGAMVMVFLVSRIIRHIIRSSIEEKRDKGWGAVIGLARAAIIVIAIFVALNFWPNEYLNRVCGTESTIGSVVLKFMPDIREQIDRKLQEKEDGESDPPRPRRARSREI